MAVINSLLSEPNIVFEIPHVIWAALNDFRKAKPIKIGGKTKVADYPDALIVNKARSVANQKGYELNYVYTFDRAALEIKGTKAL
jgi:predicted nucleic-acid-binding protein